MGHSDGDAQLRDRPNAEILSRAPGQGWGGGGRDNITFLEFGFGTGDFIECIRHHQGIAVTGVDKDARACSQVSMRCDVETYPELDQVASKCGRDYFDIIYTAHTLEHLVDLRRPLEQLLLLLKPGGLLVVMVPCFSPLAKYFEHFYLRYINKTLGYSLVQKGHLNYFTAKTLRRYLLEAGFRHLRDLPGLFGEEFLKKFGVHSFRTAKLLFRTEEILQIPQNAFGGSFLITTYATKCRITMP